MKKIIVLSLTLLVLMTAWQGITAFAADPVAAEPVTVVAEDAEGTSYVGWENAYVYNNRLYNFDPNDYDRGEYATETLWLTDKAADMVAEGHYSFAVAFAGNGTSTPYTAALSALNPALGSNGNDVMVESIVIPSSVTRSSNGLTYEVRPGGARIVPQNNTRLKSVVFSEGIKIILGNAFSGPTQITSFTLPKYSLVEIQINGLTNSQVAGSFIVPEGVTTIGASAFNTWHNILYMEFPSTLTSMGGNQFINSQKMTNLVFNSDITEAWNNRIDNGMFNSCRALEYIEFKRTVDSGDGASIVTEKMLEDGVLNIPQGITSIGNSAFRYVTNNAPANKKITKVMIPSSVTSIETLAFGGVSTISELILNEGLLTISQEAFTDMTDLGELVVPASVTTIGNRAFLAKGTPKLQIATFKGSNIGIDFAQNNLFNNHAKLKTFIFEGKIAPRSTGGTFTFINANYTDITVYYPADGTGYGEGSAFRALFPAGTTFKPVGAKVLDITPDTDGYTVDYLMDVGLEHSSAVGLIALYGEDDRLEGVKTISMAETSVFFETEANVKSAKAFIWSDLIGAKPLYASDTLDVD